MGAQSARPPREGEPDVHARDEGATSSAAASIGFGTPRSHAACTGSSEPGKRRRMARMPARRRTAGMERGHDGEAEPRGDEAEERRGGVGGEPLPDRRAQGLHRLPLQRAARRVGTEGEERQLGRAGAESTRVCRAAGWLAGSTRKPQTLATSRASTSEESRGGGPRPKSSSPVRRSVTSGARSSVSVTSTSAWRRWSAPEPARQQLLDEERGGADPQRAAEAAARSASTVIRSDSRKGADQRRGGPGRAG